MPFLSDLIVGFLGLEALLRVEVDDEELPLGVTELTTVFVGSWAGVGVKFEIVTLLLSLSVTVACESLAAVAFVLLTVVPNSSA